MSPRRYRIVIEGELGPRYASAFDGMTLHAHHGETEITGPITDDAHLQGLIQRIAGLGLKLHSLIPLDTKNKDAETPTRPQPAAANNHRPSTNSTGTANR
ncbi:MAG: hypothetical protein ACXVH3_33075 [Solirubrobacteraceae bacterium]